MKGMDLLAFLYWSEKRTHDLEKLIQRLTELDYRETRSEPWIGVNTIFVNLSSLFFERNFTFFSMCVLFSSSLLCTIDQQRHSCVILCPKSSHMQRISKLGGPHLQRKYSFRLRQQAGSLCSFQGSYADVQLPL